jgi:hypothetical protein
MIFIENEKVFKISFYKCNEQVRIIYVVWNSHGCYSDNLALDVGNWVMLANEYPSNNIYVRRVER